jgi:hypothetical protein
MSDETSTLASNSNNVLLRSMSIAAEEEDCILTSYNTTRLQRKVLRSYLRDLGNKERNEDDSRSMFLDAVPIHWIIEVADEYCGWYEATARKFYVASRQLFIEVLDQAGKEIVYEGLVPLDPRVVRFSECRDNHSQALVNQLVRDSIKKVKWELDWFDTSPPKVSPSVTITSSQHTNSSNSSKNDKEQQIVKPVTGEWHRSFARYYIPILNAVLVEDYIPLSSFQSTDVEDNQDDDEDNVVRGLALVYIDHNVRLCKHFDRSKRTRPSVADFVRLILEEGIKCTHEARDQVAAYLRESYDPNKASSANNAVCHNVGTKNICSTSSSSSGVQRGTNNNIHNKPRKASLCAICMERPVKSVALVPCGHMIMCEACLSLVHPRYDSLQACVSGRKTSPQALSSAASAGSPGNMLTMHRGCMTECPLCRQDIISKLTVYSR